MAKFYTRLDAYKRSLEKLKLVKNIRWSEEDEFVIGFIWNGVISKFSITFDLAWKLMKDLLIQEHGIANFAKGSPKEILRASFEADIINDHDWAVMLKDRNEITHDYSDTDVVDQWCSKIVNKYIPLMQELLEYAEAIAGVK